MIYTPPEVEVHQDTSGLSAHNWVDYDEKSDSALSAEIERSTTTTVSCPSAHVNVESEGSCC